MISLELEDDEAQVIYALREVEYGEVTAVKVDGYVLDTISKVRRRVKGKTYAQKRGLERR